MADPAPTRPTSPAAVVLAAGEAPPLAYETAAALIGSHRWVEQQLFAVTGAWSTSADHPAVRVHLFEMSKQHAWHAELWEDRLPVRDGVDPEALTLPLGPALGPLMQAVALLDGPRSPDSASISSSAEAEAGNSEAMGGVSADAPRLSALYRVVLPRLVATYGRHLATASSVADSPVIRALHLVLRDETAQWSVGEQLLQSLLGGAAAADLAAQVQHRLERQVVDAGIALGLVPFPSEGRR